MASVAIRKNRRIVQTTRDPTEHTGSSTQFRDQTNRSRASIGGYIGVFEVLTGVLELQISLYVGTIQIGGGGSTSSIETGLRIPRLYNVRSS